MNRDNREWETGQKFGRELPVAGRREDSGREIRSAYPKFVQRPDELPRGVLRIVDLGRAFNQLLDPRSPQVGRENFVRIVEITDDQIELPKVIFQIARQVRVPGKKAGKRSVFDRAD